MELNWTGPSTLVFDSNSPHVLDVDPPHRLHPQSHCTYSSPIKKCKSEHLGDCRSTARLLMCSVQIFPGYNLPYELTGQSSNTEIARLGHNQRWEIRCMQTFLLAMSSNIDGIAVVTCISLVSKSGRSAAKITRSGSSSACPHTTQGRL